MKLENIKGFDVLYCAGMDFADVKAQAARANAEAIGGYKDWVLPDAQTLRALALLYGKRAGCHWSSSPVSCDDYNAWIVNFFDGSVYFNSRGNCNTVRLVRASQCLSINLEGAKKSVQDAGVKSPSEELNDMHTNKTGPLLSSARPGVDSDSNCPKPDGSALHRAAPPGNAPRLTRPLMRLMKTSHLLAAIQAEPGERTPIELELLTRLEARYTQAKPAASTQQTKERKL